MPFIPLSSDGISVVCFFAEHDWKTKFTVTHFFGGSVDVGLSNRESRRPEAEALLLTVALDVIAESDEAQDLRQTFATLSRSWVGIPILADQFIGADYATTGARVYDPQRLLDLTGQVIVAASSTLVADHVYAPLVVGHITDLPPIKPASGTLSVCETTLTEDSPWPFRVGIAASVATGTWPAELLPDWNEPPIQTPTHGLVFDRIGLQREQTISDQERAFVWKSEAGFTLIGKTEIATLLGFFLASRGQWTPFDASLWYTPGTPSAEAPNETTVRFADRTLKIEFTTPVLAQARIQFVQLPWEIVGTAGETPQQPARIYLYQITYDVPGAYVWRFTNCWRPLTRSGDGTYNPAPLQHQQINGGLDLTKESITLDSFLFDTDSANNPFALFNPSILEGRLWLRVYAIETDPIDPDMATLAWFGSISGCPQDGRKFTPECLWLGGLLDREVPNVNFGTMCNTWFLSRKCGHLKAAWEKSGTLASSSGATIVITTSDAAAANTYAPGKVEIGSSLTYESRFVTASAPVVGGQQLTLDRPLRQAATGQAITYYQTCDRSMAACMSLDPTGWKGRFRALPNIPIVNLSLPSAATAPAGKK